MSIRSASKSQARRNYGNGSVYQRKPGGSWYIGYRNETGKRTQKVVSHALTKEEALLALQKEIAKIFDRAHGIEHRG